MLIEVMPALIADVDEKYLDEICNRLSIEIPAQDGAYWVSRKERGVSDDLVQEAMAGPWPKERFPQVAEWLAANEKFLDRLIDASRRTRFFVPVVCSDLSVAGIELSHAPLIRALLPAFDAEREIVYALTARAMLRVEEKRFADARGDLTAAHRWSRFAGQQPFLVDWLLSSNLEVAVCRAEVAFALHQELSSRELGSLRTSWDDLPARLPLSEVFDRAERYVFLENVQLISEGSALRLLEVFMALTADHQPEPAVVFVAHIDFEKAGDALAGLAWQIGTDWNGILREANGWFDRVVEAIEDPAPRERRRRLAKLGGEYEFPGSSLQDELHRRRVGNTLRLWARGQKIYIAATVGTLSAYGEVMHDMIFAFMLPATAAAAHREFAVQATFDMTRIAIEIAAYRHEHGRLPGSLEDLVPGRLKELPRDPHSDKPYRYRRDGEGIVLYSVGRNGEDEQGTEPDPDTYTDGKLDDIAVRWTP
ncbi:MAG: hypothetical protein WD069_11935 [Planctomycetales bacterium]